MRSVWLVWMGWISISLSVGATEVIVVSPRDPIPNDGAGASFEFDVSWNNIRAGKLKMNDHGEDEFEIGHARKFSAEAYTTDLIKYIYKDYRRWHSYLDANCQSVQFEEWRKRRSGLTRRSYIAFDRPEQNLASRYRHEEKQDDLELPENTFGPGSLLQKIRTMTLEFGKRYHVRTVEGNDFIDIFFVPQPAGVRQTRIGRIETFTTQPEFFENGERITAWSAQLLISAATPRVPLSARIGTWFGPLSIELRRYSPPTIPEESAEPEDPEDEI